MTVSAKLNWMAYSKLPWRPLLGHQAWSWTTLRRGNVFYYVYKLFFIFVTFLTFFNFYFNVFTSMGKSTLGGPKKSLRDDLWSQIFYFNHWVRSQYRIISRQTCRCGQRGILLRMRRSCLQADRWRSSATRGTSACSRRCDRRDACTSSCRNSLSAAPHKHHM